MSKMLYLLRHAESSEKKSGQTDKDRELTSAGMHAAFQLGTHLRQQNIFFDTIITSSAERAHATTQLVTDALQKKDISIIVEDDIYDASARTLLEYIRNLDNTLNTALLVGHNPSISYVAEYLTKSEKVSSLPPCGLCIIRPHLSTWNEIAEGKNELVNYITPDNLKI